MFRMLMNMKVFNKLILLFLMGLARHAQSTWVSLQCLRDILRKKLGIKGLNCTGWFKYYSYKLYIKCSFTNDPDLINCLYM